MGSEVNKDPKNWIPGGLARNTLPSEFDEDQIQMGEDVEREHFVGGGIPEAKVREMAREIARDHLKELPDYYTRLKNIEKKTAAEDEPNSVGLFIPLPEHLAVLFPKKEEDTSRPHVTFLFIGKTHQSRMDFLLGILSDEISSQKGPVEASLDGLDCFVNPNKSKVAFSRVRFSRDLNNLRDRIKNRLQYEGFTVEDAHPRWTPHVTLAYLKDLHSFWESPAPKGRWEFSGVELWSNFGNKVLGDFQFQVSPKPILQRSPEIGIARVAKSNLISSVPIVKKGCIIAAGEWGGDVCLLKNRDRNYKPEVRIYHEIREGVEVLYARDEITDWTEGINEFGIGVVNAALMVGHDEAEKKLVKTVGKKSKDGERVLKLLEKSTLEDAVEVACGFKGGIKGHSFVSDENKTISIEQTSSHECVKKSVSTSKIHVRTNHGFHHSDAGYTEGDDYVSSVARRDQAKKSLRGVDSPEEIAPALYGKRKKDLKDPNNMVRDTDNMRTTSQLVLNLSKKQALFYIIPDKVKYLGYKKDLPKGYKPKLSLQVLEYTDLDGDGEFDVLEKKV